MVGGRRRADLLDRVRRPLTVLVAPAGAGKTALLAYWASRAPVAPLWFDGVEARDREALRELLAASVIGPVVIVDDAQGLTAAEWDPLVAAVRRGDARVVLASRRDLPLPVVALELSGRLRILRGDHLRLTVTETRELVMTHAPDAAAADMDAVARRADGWAAAVILGALALASAADRDTARAALIATDQPVLDYLLDEVFSSLPVATRHVLLCTADEDRVSAEAAHVLSGDPTAAACLAQLAVEGMFVAAFDSADGKGTAHPAWVYHPLLLELLHRQTAPGRPDARLAAAAHARAAAHYEADDPVEALRHAVASRRPALVVELLVRHCPRLLATGHRVAVQRAIAAVPTEVARGRALLVVAALERRAAGDVESVLRIAGELPAAASTVADRAGAAAPGLAALVDADEAALRLWLTRTGFGDGQAAVADVLRWLRPAAGAGQAPALDPARLAGLVVDLAYGVLMAGDLENAAAYAQRAAGLSRAAGSARLTAAAGSVTAVVELVAARFQSAALVAGQALEQLGGTDPDEGSIGPSSQHATLQAVLGWAAAYASDGAAARHHLDLAREALIPGADPVGAGLIRQLAARVLAVEGDLAVAQRVVASDTEGPGGPPFLRAMLEMLRGELALTAGDPAAAAVHAEALRGYGWEAERRLLAARLAVRAGRPETVPALLAPVLHPSLGQAPRAEACATAAVAFELILAVDGSPVDGADAVGDDLRARLRDVLSRAAPQRRIRIFAPGSSSPGFISLVRREAEADDGHPFARDVLDALLRAAPQEVPLQHAPAAVTDPAPAREARAPAQRDGPRHGPVLTAHRPDRALGALPPSSALPVAPRAGGDSRTRRAAAPAPRPASVPPLTARELDVLNRLARGDEYVDIAQHLYITQNTVKTHIASLYRKLNAGRRSEALRTAWAMGLLTEVAPPPSAPLPAPEGDVPS